MLAQAACNDAQNQHVPVRLAKPLNDTGTNYCREAHVENQNLTPTKEAKVTSEPSYTQTQASPEPSSQHKNSCDRTLYKQDAHIGRDALAQKNTLKKMGTGHSSFDASRLDEKGKALDNQNTQWRSQGHEEDNSQWSCIRDNHTGLVWEVKSDDTSAFNYANLKYSWYNTNTAENGGIAGLQNTDDCNGIACNTQAYIDALNSKRLCGSEQWRLPTINEQLTLAITDFVDLAMDRNHFPNAKNDQYWSSQTYVPRRALSWYFYYSDGSAASALKTTPVYVRLVHTAPDITPTH